jgi:hypothetical protein
LAGRSSNNILHAIRTEVFGENQARFGKRLSLTKETILRLEGRKAGHRVSPKHLRWLRELRAPSGKAELMQALLAELEAAIQEELRAEASSGEHSPGVGAMPPTGQEGTGSELLRLADRSEDAARRAEEAAQRVEQLQLEVEVRAEERAAQASQEAEAAARQAEQDRVAAERRARRRALAVLAASLAVGMFGGGLVQLTSQGTWFTASDTGRADSSRDDLPDPPVDRLPEPEQEHWSGGLDAGTEPEKLLPIPKGGLPGQLAAPCPEGAEEINGFCWWRVSITADQAKGGFCEDRGFYEPSAGWCRAHHAGYLPVRSRRRPNNTFDAQ